MFYTFAGGGEINKKKKEKEEKKFIVSVAIKELNYNERLVYISLKIINAYYM